jgi:hypothetical protein
MPTNLHESILVGLERLVPSYIQSVAFYPRLPLLYFG